MITRRWIAFLLLALMLTLSGCISIALFPLGKKDDSGDWVRP